MSRRRLFCEELEARCLLSVSFMFDYTLDVNHFFDTQAKKDLLQLAGQTLTSRLSDSLAAIAPDPSNGNTWTATIDNPATGVHQNLVNLSVPADTIVVYVGGRSLPNGTLGNGGPGGFSAQGSQAWLDTVAARGQPGALATGSNQTDFGPAVGSVSLDTTNTNWYFGSTTAGLGSNQVDFLSVAVHELGHVLGIGTANSWNHWVSGNTFIGPASVLSYGSAVPLLSPSHDHWAQGTLSGGVEVAMDPSLTDGTRKLFTDLDFAGLGDVGWQVVPQYSIFVQPKSPPTTTEAGGTATFTVVLSSIPTGDVTINLSSSNLNAGTLSTTQLTFTPSNALVPQTVTVTGVDDGPIAGDIPYTIVTAPALSTDSHYRGIDPADVALTNLEQDPPPPPFHSPPAGIVNVTSQVSVSRGHVQHRGNRDRLTLKLTNVGRMTVQGPISVVFVNLNRRIKLRGGTGTTRTQAPAGAPYLDLSIGQIAAGQSIMLVVDFRNPHHRGLQFSLEVLAGPGTR